MEIIRDKQPGRILGTKPEAMPTLEEILNRTIPVPFSGCLLWEGMYATRFFYPIIKRQRRTWMVTRLVLEAKLGRPLLPGMLACHTCDVPLCVREDHLFEGTNQDNQIDAREKGIKTGTRGSGRPLAKLKETNIPIIRRMLSEDKKQIFIAQQFGVNQSQISRIKTGDRNAWTHVRGG